MLRKESLELLNNNFWLVVFKNGHETVISEWMDGPSYFLHATTYSGKVKVTWDSMICCISKMNEWIELIFWMLISVGKAKSYYGYAHGQIWLRPFRSWDSKICFISRINWWTTACCHYSANKMQDKQKNKLIRERFSCFVDYKTTLHFL